MLLQLIFGIWLKDVTGGAVSLPISGVAGPRALYPDWMYYILPRHHPGLRGRRAYTARIMRSQLLDVMNQDYIRTAKAKGLSKGAIIRKHALKNALIPVVTYVGMDFGAMLAGAILTETVFSLARYRPRDLRRHHPARLAHRHGVRSRSSSWWSWSSTLS